MTVSSPSKKETEKSALAKQMERLLGNMEKVEASDLHLKVHSPPIYRVHGTPRRIDAPPMGVETIENLITEILSDEQIKRLKSVGSVDFAYSLPKVGRFRVSAFRQRGTLSLAARRVNSVVPTVEELNLPKAINRISAFESGLVLVVGPTGSGKTTTLASILSQINASRRCHILTIEDPIEYIYRDDKAFINQREVGLDVEDFFSALKYGLRQDPDVILVGEMRDADTIETALAASETGHLVFATVHSRNATQTIGRILDFFPGDKQNPIRQTLAFTMRAVAAQKLLPGAKPEAPRVPAVELMFVNAVIRKMISDDQDGRIPDAIRSMARDGMQDFNMSLYRLVETGMVTEQSALEASPNPDQLRMQFKGMVLNRDQAAMGTS